MALISNGTTVASGGSVTISSSAVGSATAGITSGSVGSYACMRHSSTSGTYSNNSTIAGSSIIYHTTGSYGGSSASGTWRIHGHKEAASGANSQTTVMMRIS